MADAICLFIRLHVCTQADTDHPANPGAGSPVSSSSLPASVPQAPISSGWRRGPTWGLEGCPFVSRAPWVFWEQEGCESPARPLSSRMPGPLLATGRAFVAARAQERGQAQGLAGVGSSARGPGPSEPPCPLGWKWLFPGPPRLAVRPGELVPRTLMPAVPPPQLSGIPREGRPGQKSQGKACPRRPQRVGCAGVSVSPFAFVAPFTLVFTAPRGSRECVP